MDLIGNVLLFAGMLFGLLVIPLGMPGAAIILVSVLIYALATGFNEPFGVSFIIVLAILTAIAETADNVLTALGARRFGGSSASMWMSMVGGLVGAILLGSPLAFVFGPLGPLAGGIVGAFAVVVLYEYQRGKDARAALRAGWGTFLGRMAGTMLKLVIAIGMFIAVSAAIIG
jgi:uncharacterized protein YqgC (DUF456 family)